MENGESHPAGWYPIQEGRAQKGVVTPERAGASMVIEEKSLQWRVREENASGKKE